MHALLVFLGAGLGGVLRHGINLLAARSGTSFPWGTLVINITGSVAMGVFTGWFVARGGAQATRLFLATGVLGGYTTFSTFSLEAWLLFERGEALAALAYVLGSVIVGILGLFLGLYVMRQVL